MSSSNAGSGHLAVPTISKGNAGSHEASAFSSWCGSKAGTTSGVNDPTSLRLYTEAAYRLTQIPTVLWADEPALKQFFKMRKEFQEHEIHYRMLREATRFRWSAKLQGVLTACLQGSDADAVTSDIEVFSFKLQSAVHRRSRHSEIHNHPADFADLGPAGPAIEELLAKKLRGLLLYVESAARFQTIMKFGAYDKVEAEVRTNIDSIIRYFLNDDKGNIVTLQERTLNLPRFTYFDTVDSKRRDRKDADSALSGQFDDYLAIQKNAITDWSAPQLRSYGVSSSLYSAYAEELDEDLPALLREQHQRSVNTPAAWAAVSQEYLKVTPNFFTSRQVKYGLTAAFEDPAFKERLTLEYALVRLTKAEIERTFQTDTGDGDAAPDSTTKRSDFLGRTVNPTEGQDIIGTAVFDAERRNAESAHASDQGSLNEGLPQARAPPDIRQEAYNGENNNVTNDAILIPILMGENKRLKLASSFDVRGPNQERMYVFAGVRFLRLFNIHDIPVFGYVSEGNTVAVSSAWSTRVRGTRKAVPDSTWILERKTVVYQLDVPADAVNFATFLAWIKYKHVPRLRNAILEKEHEFLKFVKAALSENPEVQWTQTHQNPSKKSD